MANSNEVTNESTASPSENGNVRVTIQQVAQVAGISVSTVYRCLKKSPAVTSETAQRVEDAISALGFDHASVTRGRPRVLGAPGKTRPRSQNNHHSRVLKLVLLVSARVKIDSNPFFSPALASLMHCVKPHGTLTMMRAGHSVAETASDLAAFGADGVIALLGDDLSDTNHLHAIRSQFPLIWMLGADVTGSACAHVTSDNISVGKIAFDYLNEAGGNPLWFLTAKPERELFYRRWSGFRLKALRQRRPVLAILMDPAGIDPMTANLYGPDAVHIMDFAEAAEVLNQAPARCGVFVAADYMLRQLLPDLTPLLTAGSDRLRLISCDNVVSYPPSLHPRPANISLEVDSIAAIAVAELVQQIQDPDRPGRDILIQPRLVRGDDKE